MEYSRGEIMGKREKDEEQSARRIQSRKDKMFDAVLYIIIIVCLFLCLAPIVYMVSVSFSSIRAINSHEVYLWPVEPTLLNYKKVFKDNSIFKSIYNSLFVTVGNTAFAMVMTILCAYPLTKKRLKGRRIITLMIIFTMIFYGGIIPDYLLIKDLNLLNSLWALIIPCSLNTFNMIILRTFFMNSVPKGIEEAAMVDGCNDFRTLIQIVLPLCKPVLATLALFYAVARWNGFQDAKFYVTNAANYTLPQKIDALINSTQITSVTMLQTGSSTENATSEGIESATIIIATIPILVVYPWLQKYFVHGVTVGAIKE